MEEKPFPPSKKKLQKARKKGEVPKSRLLASALFFLGVLLLLRLSAPYFYSAFVDLMQFKETLSFKPLIIILVIFWVGVILIGAFVHLIQTGWLLTWSSLKPKWNIKMNVEWNLFLVAIDIAIILALFLALIRPDMSWVDRDAASKLKLVLEKSFSVSLIISLSLVFLGLLDWRYTKWHFMKKMGMSAAEKAEEERENEVKK